MLTMEFTLYIEYLVFMTGGSILFTGVDTPVLMLTIGVHTIEEIQ